MFEFNIAS